MSSSTYNIVVLIFTENNVDDIDRCIKSVLNQTFDSKRIHIVVVDNFSTDGTYEKVLQYVESNKLSAYRLDKKYLKTRTMLKATRLLRHTPYKYITILNPTDTLSPECIEKCSRMFDESTNPNVRMLFCETNLVSSNGVAIEKETLFEENNILEKNKNFIDLLLNGMGNKIQCFFQNGAINYELVELPHFVDFTDCFKKSYFLIDGDILYLKEKLATVVKTKYEDPIDDLMYRLYFLTRLKISRENIKTEDTEFLEPLNSNSKINESLAMLALDYASETILDKDFSLTNKILLFAEMVNEDIITNELYLSIKNEIEYK